jgi:hypothetical protein
MHTLIQSSQSSAFGQCLTGRAVRWAELDGTNVIESCCGADSVIIMAQWKEAPRWAPLNLNIWPCNNISLIQGYLFIDSKTIDSVPQGRDIVMHPKMVEDFSFLTFRVLWSPLSPHRWSNIIFALRHKCTYLLLFMHSCL